MDIVVNSFNTSAERNQEQRIEQAEESDKDDAMKIKEYACDEKEQQDGSRSECSSFEETSSEEDLNDESAIDVVAPSIEQSYRESAFPS